MTQPQTTPYGSWKSPISTDLIVADSVSLGQTALDGDDVYWVEQRPADGGRNVIVRYTPDGKATDVNPPPFNARTRVHEYGGGTYMVSDGAVYFSNYSDQRLYRQDPGEEPHPITREAEMRYADAIMDRQRNRLICVREDHTVEGREAVNTLVGLSPDGGEDNVGRVLVSGNDFYSSPRLSPDGTKLAWLTWNHPNMPWDGTQLWVGQIEPDGSIGKSEQVAGMSVAGVGEAVFQPEWSPDGTLYFVSDRTGWWNLYRLRDGKTEPLHEMEAEFGRPQWVFGLSTYGFDAAGRLICSYIQQSVGRLAAIDTSTRSFQPIEFPYPNISSLRVGDRRAVLVAGSPIEAWSVVQLDLASGQTQVLKHASDVQVNPGYISVPEAIDFPTENGLTAHGFFYAPKNRDYVAPDGEKPPVLVISHGGPTGSTSTTLSLSTHYWTSRGIAVLDVNYGGSTGYGTAYRRRLNGQWGVVDVDDCGNGARYLIQRGEVDPDRLAIRGGSAGGYTTLCALTFRDLFKAGASYYGISDLEVFAGDTHKFESRYLDSLVGPYPDRQDLYRDRSAIHYTDQLSCPIIFFQGLEDKVVPPNQAEIMVEALRAKKLPVAYLAFEGEQHGFRKANTIKRTLEAELYFYSRIFGFQPADKIEPVEIENET